jgi:hypothetical protein
MPAGARALGPFQHFADLGVVQAIQGCRRPWNAAWVRVASV